jgi:hypothetical protein
MTIFRDIWQNSNIIAMACHNFARKFTDFGRDLRPQGDPIGQPALIG